MLQTTLQNTNGATDLTLLAATSEGGGAALD
ncbi:hypothetical protein BH09ACT7_BH09ACT7_58820 [soil metagenome]